MWPSPGGHLLLFPSPPSIPMASSPCPPHCPEWPLKAQQWPLAGVCMCVGRVYPPPSPKRGKGATCYRNLPKPGLCPQQQKLGLTCSLSFLEKYKRLTVPGRPCCQMVRTVHTCTLPVCARPACLQILAHLILTTTLGAVYDYCLPFQGEETERSSNLPRVTQSAKLT